MRTAPGLALLLLCACSTSTNVNGTLRANQGTIFEGPLWSDQRCTEGAGFTNCCTRRDAWCLDFHEYLVADVRVSGQRVAVLFNADDGYLLAVSDDLGSTWKQVPVGSVGGMAQFQSMALHLAGNDVYLLVGEVVPSPGGNVTRTYPVKVDLETAKTAPASDRSWYLLSMTPAAVDGGTSYGVVIASEDARGSNVCTATLEAWTPGKAVVRSHTSFPGGCGEFPISAANSPAVFEVLQEYGGGPACLYRYDARTNTGSSTCVPTALWPAFSEPLVLASYAGERAEVLRAYAREGQAFVYTPGLAAPIALGPGVPQRHRGTAARLRYAGFVLLAQADGASTLVRVNRDGTADEALLPGSPCEGNPTSCFDPKNAGIARGGYRDTLWVEPLANDEFLVLYVHDLAPGLNQYKPLFTASREKATWRRIVAGPGASVMGPPGYPNATKAGPAAEACVRRQACLGAAAGDFYSCAGWLIRQTGNLPNLDAAVAEQRAASCSADAMQPGWLECRLRGGEPRVVPQPNTTPYVDCVMPGVLTGAACGTCVVDVAVTCPAGPTRVTPVNCASGGLVCRAGRCVSAAGCADASEWSCQGDVGRFCTMSDPMAARCDLFNMTCDASARPPAWRPCMAKQAPSQTGSPTPPRCEGHYLLWELNGVQWADCAALGYASCAGGRCVP